MGIFTWNLSEEKETDVERPLIMGYDFTNSELPLPNSWFSVADVSVLVQAVQLPQAQSTNTRLFWSRFGWTRHISLSIYCAILVKSDYNASAQS